MTDRAKIKALEKRVAALEKKLTAAPQVLATPPAPEGRMEAVEGSDGKEWYGDGPAPAEEEKMSRIEIERQVQRKFADQGIDVQAWPWWAWIDVIVDMEMMSYDT